MTALYSLSSEPADFLAEAALGPHRPLAHLVPDLLALFPAWGPEDLEEFLEERTGRPLHPEDRTTLRALWLRQTLGFPARP